MELLSFHSNNGHANAPKCYVIRILPVLLTWALVGNRDQITTVPCPGVGRSSVPPDDFGGPHNLFAYW